MQVVEVRKHLPPNAHIGFGLFIKAPLVKAGTEVASFDGEIVQCKDENGEITRRPPIGSYIVCLGEEEGVYLDCSQNKQFGEEGFEDHCAHFANSSHPLLDPPFNEPNAVLLGCPFQPTRNVLKLTKALRKGDEVLWDYHYQLVKKELVRRCRDESCEGCADVYRTPRWPCEEMPSGEDTNLKRKIESATSSCPPSSTKKMKKNLLILHPPVCSSTSEDSFSETSAASYSDLLGKRNILQLHCPSSSSSETGFLSDCNVTPLASDEEGGTSPARCEDTLLELYPPGSDSTVSSVTPSPPSSPAKGAALTTTNPPVTPVQLFSQRNFSETTPQGASKVIPSGRDLLTPPHITRSSSVPVADFPVRDNVEFWTPPTVNRSRSVPPAASISRGKGGGSVASASSPNSFVHMKTWSYGQLAEYLLCEYECSKGCDFQCSLLKVFKAENLWEEWKICLKHKSVKERLDDVYSFMQNCIGTEHRTPLTYKGFPVCDKAFMLANFLPRTTFYKLKARACKGYRFRNLSQVNITRADTALGDATSNKTQIIMDYFECLKNDGTCDLMPIAKFGKDEVYQYVLPYFNKGDAFKAFESHIQKMNQLGHISCTISSTHFRRVWKEHFSSVVPSAKSTANFAQCNTCAVAKEAILNANNMGELEQLRIHRSKHLLRAKLERRFYAVRKSHGEFESAGKVLSMIIDACDYNKFGLIRPKGRPSKLLDKPVLGQSLQTVLVHGRGIYQYSTRPHVNQGGGVNFTLECLMRTFDKLQLQNPSIPLPSKLYLQLDNCSGSNKNKYMLAFADRLVRKGVFKEVVLSFLMVGHTHEDIDQLFSVISYKLRQRDLVSPTSLGKLCVRALEKAGHSNVHFEILSFQHDYKSWLLPYIDPDLKGYSKPHVFSFSMTECGTKVRMRYKHWHRCFKWYPFQTDCEELGEMPGCDDKDEELVDNEDKDYGHVDETLKPWEGCDALKKLALRNKIPIGSDMVLVDLTNNAALQQSTSVDLHAEASDSYLPMKRLMARKSLPMGGSLYKNDNHTRKEQASFHSSPGLSVLLETKLDEVGGDIGIPPREPFRLSPAHCPYGISEKSGKKKKKFKKWRNHVRDVLNRGGVAVLPRHKAAWEELFELHKEICDGTRTAQNDSSWTFRWPLPTIEGNSSALGAATAEVQNQSRTFYDKRAAEGESDSDDAGRAGGCVRHAEDRETGKERRVAAETRMAAVPVDVKKGDFICCARDITAVDEWENVKGYHENEAKLPIMFAEVAEDTAAETEDIPVVFYRVNQGNPNYKIFPAHNGKQVIKGKVPRQTVVLTGISLTKKGYVPAKYLKRLAKTEYDGPLKLPFAWQLRGKKYKLVHLKDINGKPLPIEGFSDSTIASKKPIMSKGPAKDGGKSDSSDSSDDDEEEDENGKKVKKVTYVYDSSSEDENAGGAGEILQ